jgi:hypothetical protein
VNDFPEIFKILPQNAMLQYSDESHIELLSLSQDLERIYQHFFSSDESPKHAQEGTNAFQIESTLAALAEECQQIPAIE